MLKQIIDSHSKSTSGFNLWYRWGMLVVFLGLLGWTLNNALSRGNTDWQKIAQRCAVPVLLLVNHLTIAFEWPRRIQVIWFSVAAVTLGLVIWSQERESVAD